MNTDSYFHVGWAINFFGSVIVNILLIIFGMKICELFGADEKTLEYTVETMPLYSLGFIMMSFNTMISAYLFSTKRSKQADTINILRSFVINSIIILNLSKIFGSEIIWHTFGIYEGIVF